MRLQFGGVAAVGILLICSAVPAQAQRSRPATAAQPGTSTSAQPTTTTAPDEATTGRAAAPGQTGTAPGAAATEPGQAGTAAGQAGITPGQEQTSPGEASQLTPAVTGQTPSGRATGQGQAAALTPVTRTDLKAGSSIYDQNGGLVGKVETVTAKGAVISTGTTRATIPISSFAKGEKGLVIGMSKADIDSQAKKASPK